MNGLVFEDDVYLGGMITRAMEEICDSVHLCETLEEVRSYRNTMPECPGVAWMDLRARDSTVPEAFDEIKAMRSICPDSILVVMSGLPAHEIADAARVAGADALAVKPFYPTKVDVAQLVAQGAIRAMGRGASDSPRVLKNVCEMAAKFFRHKSQESEPNEN